MSTSNIESASNLSYFALFSGEVCTANPDQSIPINSRYGGEVLLACIAQANLAPQLLEALRKFCINCDVSIQGGAMVDAYHAAMEAIAKAEGKQ